jgi:Tol biopolymer transport system component
MFMKKICLVVSVCISSLIYAQPANVTKTADSSRVFGPDIISTGDNEFNATFTPDGNTVFFSKTSGGWSYIAIYASTKKNGIWSEPAAVPFTGVYRDTDPFVSPDGTRLYFMSDRPLPGKSFAHFNYNIYYVDLKGANTFSEPILVDIPYQDGMKGMYPSVAANGNIYFLSRKGSDADIYMSRFENGKYMIPESLSFNDKNFNDIDPIVSKDERFLVFSSDNRKGYGNSDIWISFRNKDNTWSDPMNLGNKVNTTSNESAPGISADNKKIYFSAYKEKLDRVALSKEKDISKNADKILHSYKNGNTNIYEIDISDVITQK